MTKSSKGSFSPVKNADIHNTSQDGDTDGSFTRKLSVPERYALSPDESEKLQHNKKQDESDSDSVTCCSKYSNALKVLLPCRPARKDKSKLPANKAGLFGFITVGWLTGLMWKAFRKGLNKGDLWKLHDEDAAGTSYNRLYRIWESEKELAEKNGKEPELWRAAYRMARTRTLVTLWLSVGMNILYFVGPSVLLKMILDYIDDPYIDHIYGGYLVAAIFVISLVRGALFNVMMLVGAHTATRVTGGLQLLMYNKILKLKTGGEKLSAQITNILTNDLDRIYEAALSVSFLTASPVIFLLTCIYSVIIIGPWALLGNGVFLLFYPIMGLIAKGQSKIRLKTVKVTDKRVSLMSEILNSLKLIKMYAWEESFGDKIVRIRNEELKRHRLGALLQAVSSTCIPSVAIVATMTTLLGYTLNGYPLTASQAFTIFSAFSAMTFTMGVLPFTIRSIAEAKISLARVQKLLELPEHAKDARGGLLDNSLAVQIKNAVFAWEVHSIDLKLRSQTEQEAASKEKNKKEGTPQKLNNALEDKKDKNGLLQNDEKVEFLPKTEREGSSSSDKSASPAAKSDKGDSTHRESSGSVEISETLFGVNLSVERGKLVGICGSIGSGKSSLVAAICGDMQIRTGQLQVNGRLALVSQQAWIYNASFRENILVGLPYNEEKYNNVIDVCCLKEDVEMLSCGDLTEIGEKGVNLRMF